MVGVILCFDLKSSIQKGEFSGPRVTNFIQKPLLKKKKKNHEDFVKRVDCSRRQNGVSEMCQALKTDEATETVSIYSSSRIVN